MNQKTLEATISDLAVAVIVEGRTSLAPRLRMLRERLAEWQTTPVKSRKPKPVRMGRQESRELQDSWNRFLDSIDKFDKTSEKVIVESDFGIDGELRGCRESWSGSTQEANVGERGFYEADLAGTGVEDFVGMDDDAVGPQRPCRCVNFNPDIHDEEPECDAEPSQRWAHVRDAHQAERVSMRSAYLRAYSGPGGNPRGTYYWMRGRERQERADRIIKWVARAPLAKVLAYRNEAKKRYKLSMARMLGFDRVPDGRWPGVEPAKGIGLVRHYPDVVAGQRVTVTRIPEWSGLYLTKKQLGWIEDDIKSRCY